MRRNYLPQWGSLLIPFGAVSFQEAVKIGASAEASLRLSAGPELVASQLPPVSSFCFVCLGDSTGSRFVSSQVWPMPGIPITFLPKFHAEAKAKGMIQHPPSSSLACILESSCPELQSPLIKELT